MSVPTVGLAFLAAALMGDGVFERVEPLVKEAFASGLAPGMSVAVVAAGGVAFEGAYGVADLEGGRAVSKATRFYIASSSKALTALAAARLAARGAIDLDAPLSRVFPGIAFPKGVDADAVRLRDLLTHTHGIDGQGPITVRMSVSGDYTNELVLSLLREHRALPTGRAYRYSNVGYELFGIALAPKGRDGWKDVVEREVLAPLGMKSTTARVSSVPPEDLALPHASSPSPAGFERIRLQKDDTNLSPAGGHFSTAADLARVVLAELSAGKVDGAQAIEPEAIAATQRLSVEQDRDYAYYHRSGWGLGWDLGTYDGEPFTHRFGEFAGYRCHVSFLPQRGVGVVVLLNCDGAAAGLADVVATAAYDALLGRADARERMTSRLATLGTRVAASRTAAAEDRARRAARPAGLPRPIADYAGAYANPLFGTIDLREEGGRLVAILGAARSAVERGEGAGGDLSIDLIGSPMPIPVAFPPEGGGPAESIRFLGAKFERRP